MLANANLLIILPREKTETACVIDVILSREGNNVAGASEVPIGRAESDETDLTMTAEASTDCPTGCAVTTLRARWRVTPRQGALTDLHLKTNLLNQAKAITLVQSPRQKYSDFQKTQISL
jgi:hypothetical protein